MAKKREMRLKFCKGDVVVIFFVVMLAVLVGVLFLMKTGMNKGNTVVIYQEGKKIQEFSLYEDREILIENNYANKLLIKNVKAAIVESDCPGMDCVYSGWIGEQGRSLICLPNRVEIRIQGETEAEVDFIVR